MSEQSRLSPLRLAVLLSGRGTTLENFLHQIEAQSLDAKVVLVISSSPSAGGLEIARGANIPTAVFKRRDFEDRQAYSAAIFERCRTVNPDLVALAGFLKRLSIPDDFQNRIMNVHPALLPSFGGRGLYGSHVHEAVLAHGAKVSGCTVHFVDDQYDHGPIILQRTVAVLDDDTPVSLAARVVEQERIAYPRAVELFAERKLRVEGRRVFVDE